MTYGPLFPVDAPQPLAARHTLLSSANIVPETDDHWMNGLAMRPWPADKPDAHDPCNEGSSGGPKDAGSATSELDWSTFTVVMAGTCSGRGIVSDADYKNRIGQLFASREHWRVEREFEQGPVVSGQNTVYLSEANVAGAPLTTITATATSPLNALALLEEAIGNTANAGMIHAPRAVVTHWLTNGSVTEVNGKLVTGLGTIVVPGTGYQGKPPNGVAANGTTEYAAYATGLVDIRRSSMFLNPTKISEALDRAQNVVTYWAERHYAFDWDAAALRAWVRIDRCKTTC